MNLRGEELESGIPPTRLSRDVDALAVLVAAGRSTRLPAEVPKQLLKLEGLPVVTWAARALESAGGVVGILPVHPADLELELAEALAMGGLKTLLPGVPGGDTRQESVIAGVLALPPGPDIVLVHDAARPLADAALVERVIKAAALHGAAVPVRPVSDTVKEVVGDQVVRTLDRTKLRLAQTPQGFRRKVLLKAIRTARETGETYTDEAAMVEASGHKVVTVAGDARNIKITEPMDLALADCILRGMGEE